MVFDSPIPIENFFFCCGGNSLSIGVGLLRSAAKRRTQLNVKNQNFLKPIQVFYPSFTSKLKSFKGQTCETEKISYPDVSTVLWGYSKPWNINRLISIGSRREAIQYNTLQPNDLGKDKNYKLSYLNKNVLFARMAKKINVLRSKTLGWGEKSFRNPLPEGGAQPPYRFFKPPVPPKGVIGGSNFFYSIATAEDVNPKAVAKPDQGITFEKSNDNFKYCDQINNTKRKNPPTQLDLSLSFSLEKQNFSIGYNDASVIEKEWVYHSLVNNCFSKAFFLIDQNRQLTDYFADYLVRFQILRQHQILYLFSAVLLRCKKQT